MISELWKAVPSYAGYEASDCGRVRKLSRLGKYALIVQHLNIKGYPRVGICSGGRHTTAPVHRLVALAFVANPKHMPEVNHKNAIKTDNVPENLEWVSRQENMSHAARLQLLPYGENHRAARFTDDQIITIRTLLLQGMSSTKVGLMFKASSAYMRQIGLGQARSRKTLKALT